LKQFSLFLLLLICTSCQITSDKSYDAVVDVAYSGLSGALINDIPTFKTISEALAVIPEFNDKPFLVFISKGRYYEKNTIESNNVHLIGADRDSTIITFDANGDTPAPDGSPYGTWGCATLIITAPGFHAVNLTIENGFDYPANALKMDNDSTKAKNPQAVALMTSVKSDKAVFRNCIIKGFQDTVFPNAGRNYFFNCEISGHVDFIFGAGQAVFEDCDIISRNRINKNPTGYIAAPSTPISFPFGFLFVDCRLLKESDQVPAGSVRLGRPWHPGADPKVSGSAVFMHCFMDDHVGPEGYAKISYKDSTGQRIWFEVKEDSRFFEYSSYGPGEIQSPHRPAIDEYAAQWYTKDNVLNGWQPEI